MPRLPGLLALKHIETHEQEEELKFFIELFRKTNLKCMRKQKVLYDKIDIITANLPPTFSNPFHDSNVVQIHKKILKIDYKNEIRYQYSKVFISLLKNEEVLTH